MSTALRDGLRIALNEPRVFGLAGGAPLLGAGAPTVRRLVDDPAATPQWAFGSTLRTVGPRLLVVAVVGHLCALALGAAAFLLVDTAVRLVVYAVGWAVPAGLVLFLPLPGVAAVTLLAWGLLVPAIA